MYFRYKIGYKSCCYYFQINHEDGSPFSKIGAAIFEQMPAAWLETFFMHNVREGALKYYKIISCSGWFDPLHSFLNSFDHRPVGLISLILSNLSN